MSSLDSTHSMDSLKQHEPPQPFTPAETRIVEGYGSWLAFCRVYGLKPANPDENDEAYCIVRQMARYDSPAPASDPASSP